MLQLFGHPFSSYFQKALIAFYENETAFAFRMVSPDPPENQAEVERLSPGGKFPVLRDGDHAVFEASIIIEYLHSRYPGPAELIPEGAAALEVRMLDRVFDNYVMTPMATIVADFIRPAETRDALTVTRAHEMLDRAYAWLDRHMAERRFAAGDDFTLADCGAAPALFYADWVRPIRSEHPHLKDYRARLLARPSIMRAVDEARPYRKFFPPGAPDRD